MGNQKSIRVAQKLLSKLRSKLLRKVPISLMALLAVSAFKCIKSQFQEPDENLNTFFTKNRLYSLTTLSSEIIFETFQF